MMDRPVIRAFTAYGIELEYMIVDRETLDVRPIADEVLRDAAGAHTHEVDRGFTGWSNELVLHLIEIKNMQPSPDLQALHAAVQADIAEINRRLAPLGACLMPTAMHPWMNPSRETRLWPHAHADIYRAYDRVFDCRQHGWANLQSMHLNLPFAGDAEFARLHAAIRLVLPILPALAASSPIVDGERCGWLDYRLEAYRTHEIRVPSLLGRIIPENVSSQAEYESQILSPLYRDIADHDPEGVLRHEWLNSRGAIARFDRNAIEIRLIDTQECPAADIAIAAATIALVRHLYEHREVEAMQAIATEKLARLLASTTLDADLAWIDEPEYLDLLGYPGDRYRARELWRHLIAEAWRGAPAMQEAWGPALETILEHGPLARRILQAIGRHHTRERLHEVYRRLCECLQLGVLFHA